MKRTAKTKRFKTKAVKAKTRALKTNFYKAPLNAISSGFNSFVSYFK